METIVGIGGATSVAMLLVALFKKGVPSAPSKAVAGIALLAGELSAILVAMASGTLAASQSAIATVAITGIISAAAAAGISRTDQSAENDRVTVGAKEPPPSSEEKI